MPLPQLLKLKLAPVVVASSFPRRCRDVLHVVVVVRPTGAVQQRRAAPLHSRRLLREVGARRIASVGFRAEGFAASGEAARALQAARLDALRHGLRLGPDATTWRWLCARYGEARCLFLADAPDGATRLATAAAVRAWHVPAVGANVRMPTHKYAARMDLMLSKSVPALSCLPETARAVAVPDGARSGAEGGLPLAVVREIDDVISPSGLVMTDGCAPAGAGVIAAAVRALRPSEPTALIPALASAVQARLGGHKGLWFLDPTLPPDVVCVRPSMRKIELDSAAATATQRHFEVLRTSGPGGCGTMNRQFALLLEGWGVPPSTLLQLLDEALQPLRGMTGSADAALAALSMGLGGGSGDVDAQSNIFWMAREAWRLLDAGLWGEARLAHLLGRLRSVRLGSLARRPRLLVRESRAAFIVADPTGLLRPGEVMLRSSSALAIEGPTLLLRNPCYAPEHLVLAQAVSGTTLALRATSPVVAERACLLEAALADVIVLPTTGASSTAQLLSGGDYDGDVAWACWDPRLVAPVAARKAAFATTPAPLLPPLAGAHGGAEGDEACSTWPYSEGVLQSLWLASLGRSELGRASNLHSALLDQLLSREAEAQSSAPPAVSRALWHPNALQLARLCDANVDAPKTGRVWPVPPALAESVVFPPYMADATAAVTQATSAEPRLSQTGWGRVCASLQALAAAPPEPLPALRPHSILLAAAAYYKAGRFRVLAEAHMAAFVSDAVVGPPDQWHPPAKPEAEGEVDDNGEGEFVLEDHDEASWAQGRATTREWCRPRARRRLFFSESSAARVRTESDRRALALAYYLVAWRHYLSRAPSPAGQPRAFAWAVADDVLCDAARHVSSLAYAEVGELALRGRGLLSQ